MQPTPAQLPRRQANKYLLETSKATTHDPAITRLTHFSFRYLATLHAMTRLYQN